MVEKEVTITATTSQHKRGYTQFIYNHPYSNKPVKGELLEPVFRNLKNN